MSGNHCFSKRGKRFVVTCVIKPFIDYIVYDRAACSVHQGINFFGLQGTRSVFLVEFSLIREEKYRMLYLCNLVQSRKKGHFASLRKPRVVKYETVCSFSNSFDTLTWWMSSTLFSWSTTAVSPEIFDATDILRLQTSKWLAKSSMCARIVVVWLCLLLLSFHSSGFVKVSSAHCFQIYTKTYPVALFTVISD